jgi:hypothetical protein
MTAILAALVMVDKRRALTNESNSCTMAMTSA